MLEKELVQLFRDSGVRLMHTNPAEPNFPYVVYDRISSLPELFPGYSSVNMAFDVCGKDMGQVAESLSKVEDIFDSLEKTNGRFAKVEQYNIVDNTFDDSKIVYTVYVRFLFRKN